MNIYDRCNTMQDLNIHKGFPVESHCQETVWIRVYLPSRRSSLLSVTVTSSHSERSKLGISGMFILSGLQGSWAHRGWVLLYNMSLCILEVNLWDCDEYRWRERKSNHSCFTVAEKVQHITTEHMQTDQRLTDLFFKQILQIMLCKHSSLHKKMSLLLYLDIMMAWVWSQRLASGYGFASALCLLFACKFK